MENQLRRPDASAHAGIHDPRLLLIKALFSAKPLPGEISKANQAAVDGDPAIQAGLEIWNGCLLSRSRQVIKAREV